MKRLTHITSKRLVRALLMLMAATMAAWRAGAADPDLPFSSSSTGADGPLTFREIAPGRNSQAMVYDPIRQEVVIFGGYSGGVGLNDMWAWRGTNWTRLLPSKVPAERYGHRMVWDAARGEAVMFGGERSTGRLNDTWTWNGTNWTEKTPANSPSPRSYFCMAFDAARNQVVLFSGNGGNDETWLWDGSNWTQATPTTKPPASGSSAMAYHSSRQECVLFGNYGQTWIWNGANWVQRPSLHIPSPRNFLTLMDDPTSTSVLLFSGNYSLADTWAWNGTDWISLSPPISPSGRQYHSMVWDAARQRGVLFGGDNYIVDTYSADTWLWDGAAWTLLSGKVQQFDLSARANGIFNFTTITVPSGVTVRFTKNTANTPVRWLASGDVTINGVIDVSGQFGSNSFPPSVRAQGGPGGFAGGRGGIKFTSSTSYVGEPGYGPGGGGPGTAQQTSPENLRDGKQGEYLGKYGNVFVQPLVGGSGGGGGASAEIYDGGNGGGGGGAILISSSRDIILNGVIRANGGDYEWSNASYGGRGSGGSILLRADRITGPGSLEAFGGNASVLSGRIRLEAYARTVTGSQTPVAVVGLPLANGELNSVGSLLITNVKGVTVASPPTGNTLTPDVIFSDTGPVQIVVTGTGIPDGTPVALRITTATTVIEPTPQNLAGGTVTFTATVPKGLGTLQATAKFTQ